MLLVDNLFERSAVPFTDRLEWTISRITDTKQVRDFVALGHTQNGAGFSCSPTDE